MKFPFLSTYLNSLWPQHVTSIYTHPHLQPHYFLLYRTPVTHIEFITWEPYASNILIFSSTSTILGLLKSWRLRHQAPSEHWCYLIIDLVSYLHSISLQIIMFIMHTAMRTKHLWNVLINLHILFTFHMADYYRWAECNWDCLYFCCVSCEIVWTW